MREGGVAEMSHPFFESPYILAGQNIIIHLLSQPTKFLKKVLANRLNLCDKELTETPDMENHHGTYRNGRKNCL